MKLLEPLRYTGFMIRRAQQIHVAVWQREVGPEVSSVQYGVLAVLARREGASQRDLCDELDLDRSTIGDLVARLERRGLVERTRTGEDRRRNAVRLTDAGRAEHDRLSPRVDDVEEVLTASLTAPERAELRRLLGLVLAGSVVEAPRRPSTAGP